MHFSMEKLEYLGNENEKNKAEMFYVIGFIKGLAIRLDGLTEDISSLKTKVDLLYRDRQVPSSEDFLEKKDHC